MNFRAYFDDENIITAEIDRIYYNGLSGSFTLIDENNTYTETEIISIDSLDIMVKYRLHSSGLEIGKSYSLVDERFLKTPVQYRLIMKSPHFDKMFFYDGDDLGSAYSAQNTEFKVWSPLSSRVILDITERGSFEMERGDRGIFQLTIPGDLKGCSYQYLLYINGKWNTANDPYAYSSTANSHKSVVIDVVDFDIPLCKEKLPPLKQKTDAVIYELHVRDLSSSESGGFRYRGKFLGLTEEGTKNKQGDSTGLDYLTDLGITHLQLLPIFDFGSVDELNQMHHYNWGYDPVHFNIPEGSYSTDCTDPLLRIKELQKTISVLHSKGIRVIMDVVYNHMFDRFTSDFENLVPGYYFRTGDNGEPSNGSFCGNDIDSTGLMVRKYIKDSIRRWMTVYGIDGFRFDLMGILDIETMNQIEELVRSIDKNAIVYGEGWNMPTLLPDELKAAMINQDKLPGISHFNDYFRDMVKGDTMLDRITHRGLLTGDTKHLEKLPGLLLGAEYNREGCRFFSAPWKSINYVECHDNHTSIDKMTASGVKADEILLRQKLMLAVVIFSRGIPFIHAGQEMCRTKKGDHNSYRSPDKINGLDWNLRSEHKDLIKYVGDAIKLRKKTDVFRSLNYDDLVEIRVEKHKKLVELKYSGGITLMINTGLHSYDIELKNEKIIFNNSGKIELISNLYTLGKLELIIIEKIHKED